MSTNFDCRFKTGDIIVATALSYLFVLSYNQDGINFSLELDHISMIWRCCCIIECHLLGTSIISYSLTCFCETRSNSALYLKFPALTVLIYTFPVKDIATSTKKDGTSNLHVMGNFVIWLNVSFKAFVPYGLIKSFAWGQSDFLYNYVKRCT